MIIYLDENISNDIAKGLHLLQIPESRKINLNIEVRALEDDFGKGCKDEDWIPIVGGNGDCIITQDIKIQRIRNQRELCNKYGAGIFFLKPPSKKGLKYWDMVRILVNVWPELCQLSITESRPFAYKITPKGKIVRV